MAKHNQAIRRLLPTNCFSVFDHFVGFVFIGLTLPYKFVISDKINIDP